MQVNRAIGRTPDTELVQRFSNWFLENMNAMDVLEDEEAVQGTITIDFQVPTASFVIEVQTYSEEFAWQCIEAMKELGFLNATSIGVIRDGGIR